LLDGLVVNLTNFDRLPSFLVAVGGGIDH